MSRDALDHQLAREASRAASSTTPRSHRPAGHPQSLADRAAVLPENTRAAGRERQTIELGSRYPGARYEAGFAHERLPLASVGANRTPVQLVHRRVSGFVA